MEQSESEEDAPNPFQGIQESVKDQIRKKIEEHKQQMDTKRITRLESRVEHLVVLVHSMEKLIKHILDVTQIQVPAGMTPQKMPKANYNSKKKARHIQEEKNSSYFGKKSGKGNSNEEEN